LTWWILLPITPGKNQSIIQPISGHPLFLYLGPTLVDLLQLPDFGAVAFVFCSPFIGRVYYFMMAAPSGQTTQRLLRELKDYAKSPNEALLHLGPVDEEDLLRWEAVLKGVNGSPYAGTFDVLLICWIRINVRPVVHSVSS
jgi:hypothetical protein